MHTCGRVLRAGDADHTRESLGRTLFEPCFYCDGTGHTQSKLTIAYEILRQIRREGHGHPEESLVVSVHPEIAELLATSDQQYLDDLEKRLQKKIVIKPRERFHIEHFEIRGAGDKDKEPDSAGKEGGKDGGGKDGGGKDNGKEGRPEPRPRGPGRPSGDSRRG